MSEGWQTPEKDGRFVDDEWLNGDPVWVIYRDADYQWIVTAKPQSIFDYAFREMLAVAGEEPGLYGHRFVSRDCMFHDQKVAQDECNRRNSRS